MDGAHCSFMAVAPDQHSYEVVAVPRPEEASPTAHLVRFAIVGAGGFVVNLLVFVTLERLLGAAHALSAIGAFAAAVLNNYVLNRWWTFQNRPGPVSRQARRFVSVSL